MRGKGLFTSVCSNFTNYSFWQWPPGLRLNPDMLLAEVRVPVAGRCEAAGEPPARPAGRGGVSMPAVSLQGRGGRRDRSAVCLEDALCLLTLRRAGREAHYWLEPLFMTLHKSLAFTINSLYYEVTLIQFLLPSLLAPPLQPEKDHPFQEHPRRDHLAGLQGSPPLLSPLHPPVSPTHRHTPYTCLTHACTVESTGRLNQRTSTGHLWSACNSQGSQPPSPAVGRDSESSGGVGKLCGGKVKAPAT